MSGIKNHGKHAYWLAAAIFFLNLFYQPLTRHTLIYFLILLGCGVLNDTLLMQMGLFKFYLHTGDFIPAWLMLLWACLSAWFLHAQWLNQRLSQVLFLFSIGGASAYYFAARLHALIFLKPSLISLIILALDWFCLGLVFFLTAKFMIRREKLRGLFMTKPG